MLCVYETRGRFTCNNLNIQNVFSKQFRSVILFIIRQTLYFQIKFNIEVLQFKYKSFNKIFHKNISTIFNLN